MLPKVSVVIPSYNRYELLRLTLTCLFRQTYPKNKFEVIVVNDSSTDATREKLANISPPCKFSLITTQRVGKFQARNLGIRASEGDIIISLDSDMLVQPNFIASHVKYHIKNQNITVTGAWARKIVITHLYPDFQPYIRQMIAYLAKNRPHVSSLLPPDWSKDPAVFPLITPLDILNNSPKIPLLSFIPSGLVNVWLGLLKRYGPELKGFAIPWILFLTGNVSVRKSLLVKAGMFDAHWQGWGLGDWETGYRLHKLGVKFRFAPELAALHQEHPVSAAGREASLLNNYCRFSQKHPDIEIFLLWKKWEHDWGLIKYSQVINQYHALSKKASYRTVTRLFMRMAQELNQFVRSGRFREEKLNFTLAQRKQMWGEKQYRIAMISLKRLEKMPKKNFSLFTSAFIELAQGSKLVPYIFAPISKQKVKDVDGIYLE